MEILLEPTSNKLLVVMRTTSTAVKPYQGDSLEFYLITGDNMDQAAAAMGESAQLKRKHEDHDKDLTAGSNQGKDKKDEEHVHDMSLDAKENIVDKMGNANEQPDGEAEPNKDNAPKNDWFKQPPRPPTPYPE
uniref:Uncharacterized protein n=1 Tax=Tanacetum cinerariifolium TaxID=118510 RepID=A0A699IKL3_TANCI|nr:hypothetical protein [Tanacetum cinerariifolium]